MNLEFKLNPINGKVLAGLNVSLPSVSKFPELSLSPQGAGGAKTSTCLFKSSHFYLGMGIFPLYGKYRLQLLSISRGPTVKAGTRFWKLISTCNFFLGQEFPLCPRIFGPSHAEQLHGAGAAVRAAQMFQRLPQAFTSSLSPLGIGKTDA